MTSMPKTVAQYLEDEMSANPLHDRLLDRRRVLLGGTTFAAASAVGVDAPLRTAQAQPGPQSITPSPSWGRALPPGPDARGKVNEDYAKHVARDAYFWAWPLVNMYNRRLAFEPIKDFIVAGPVPSAPLNKLAMLTDYISPEQRAVACPNQDVVYGAGLIGLDVSPAVIQVPDFGDRFWVYQVVDVRTDSFATLGKMYGTTPGFYMLVGPNWQGQVPKGISQVFRSSTNSGLVGPRIFMDDTADDRQAIQPVLRAVMMYPLSEYDGTMKSKDWEALPKWKPTPGGQATETQWVFPEKFFDQLLVVLADAPPLPGEEARYAQVLAVVEAAKRDSNLKAAIDRAAIEADAQLVKPLFEFRNYGLQLPGHWSTIATGAAFGTDYLTRTAVAKSNILVNAPIQAKYFYQDLDERAGRLNGTNRYSVTFAKDQTPPVHGFWSLTLYNEHHFFVPNELNRYSLGTKNKTLKTSPDGSLTFHVQADAPPQAQRDNWLPAPKGADFSLYMRTYWPKAAVIDGSWTPPAVQRVS
ncbi:MAG TPA: DUF1254 domain-containing protein [Bradyrhizobium sp.]|nr:DUF1254 domain-containing protein [Bradyrhizobium sp.]